MKQLASLILVAGLCACSGRPAGDDADATAATATADHASTAATGDSAAPSADRPAATSTVDAPAASPAPQGAQGIAVGEPNPSAPGGFQPPAGPAPATGLARFDGYGDMRFGMDVEQAKKAWAGDLKGTVHGNECSYLNPVGSKPPSNFAFMFEGGKFVRYDVGNDQEVAPGGGRRGMDKAAIEKLYAGRVQASPHHYVEGGQYLKVRGDGGALVFETDAKGVVTGWHAGVEPQVNYIEGCS